MSLEHGLIEELLAVRALDGLDGGDDELLRREMTAHGVCTECGRLEAEFEETAGRLAFALEPSPIDPGMADEVLRRAGAAAAGPARESVVGPVPAAGDELEVRRERRGGVGWRGLVAAAAALLLVVAGYVGTRPGTVSITSATPTQRFVAFTGPHGELALAYTPGEPGVVLWGQGLPDPGAGKVYEVWTITAGTPVSAGCLTPAGGAIAAAVHADVTGADLMAVTAESTACPPAPTSDPIWVAQLA